MFDLCFDKFGILTFKTSVYKIFVMFDFYFSYFRLICFTFVSSTTLEEFLQESTGAASFCELLSVMIDVIKALEHLHKIGICHNDVCPSNVLISFTEGVGRHISLNY